MCEGCGDCGDVSNCLSVQPVETPYGRKTRIHQTSCNFDFSCMKGDCPSFATVTVEASDGPRPLPTPPLIVAAPQAPLVDPDHFTVRLTGIGGTGVITVSQILGTAAMLADRNVRGLDQTGLSQKAGPVVSDVCITTDGATPSNHANASGVDAILAFDLLVGAGEANLNGARSDRTVMIASTDAVPTGSMVTEPTLRLPSGAALTERVATVTRASENRYLDAAAFADGLLGSTTTANILVLGAGVQAGAVPIPVAAIERAIELNGVAVDKNFAAFRWGRAWIDDHVSVERAADLPVTVPPETTHELTNRLADDLVGYQSAAYARRFRKIIGSTLPRGTLRRRQSDRWRCVHRAGRDPSPQADGLQGRVRSGSAAARRRGNLGVRSDRWAGHPRDVPPAPADAESPRDGPEAQAREVCSRRAQGPPQGQATAWHGGRPVPVGRGPQTRTREMIPEYIDAIEQLAARLTTENIDEAIAIASLPDQVRGYEDLKVRRAKAYRTELVDRLRRWN